MEESEKEVARKELFEERVKAALEGKRTTEEVKNAREKLRKAVYNEVMQAEKRKKESELLSPDYDYLIIDDKGFLKKGFPIFGNHTLSYDKVQVAAAIHGMDLMDARPNEGYIPFMDGSNEIYIRSERTPIYNEEDYIKEKERLEMRNTR